jgi:hypothetical protein
MDIGVCETVEVVMFRIRCLKVLHDSNYWVLWDCWHFNKYRDYLRDYGYLVAMGHKQMDVSRALLNCWQLVGFKT